MCTAEPVAMSDGSSGPFYPHDSVGHHNIHSWTTISVKMKAYIPSVGNRRFWLVNLCHMTLNRMKIRPFYIFPIYISFQHNS